MQYSLFHLEVRAGWDLNPRSRGTSTCDLARLTTGTLFYENILQNCEGIKGMYQIQGQTWNCTLCIMNESKHPPCSAGCTLYSFRAMS